MLIKLAVNTAALAGIILAIFWVTGRMAQHIVVEAGSADEPQGSFWKTLGPISLALVGILAVAAYFTVALSGIVLSARHFPSATGMVLTGVFVLMAQRFFLFLFEVVGRDRKNFASRLIAFLLGGLTALSWILHPNWLTIDLGATLAAITMLLLLRAISLRMIVVVAVGVTLYDVVAVFGTGQMIEAARSMNGLSLPMLFIIPESFELASKPAQMLGLGDVVIPGAIIFAALQKNIPHSGAWTLLGYLVGLLAALGAVYLTRFPQPATIYLVPGVLLGLVWAAHRAGMLRETFAADK